MSRELDFVTRMVALLTLVVLVGLWGWLFIETERAQGRVAAREAQLFALQAMQSERASGDRLASLDASAAHGLFPHGDVAWVRRGDAVYLTLDRDEGASAVLAMRTGR